MKETGCWSSGPHTPSSGIHLYCCLFCECAIKHLCGTMEKLILGLSAGQHWPVVRLLGAGGAREWVERVRGKGKLDLEEGGPSATES